MPAAKSKKGSHKRKTVAQTTDDSSPQPADNKRKLDDTTIAADDNQAASTETDELQPTAVDPPVPEPTPAANGAPVCSSSNQSAAATAVPSTSQPTIPSHLAYLPPCPIRLSTFDCARKLRLSSSHLSILGDKGYRTCRATHGLSAGSLYFELTYMPTPSAFTSPHSTTSSPSSSQPPRHLPPPAVRVGFSTLAADIDGCVGMDRWGYGASSRGWRGHEGVWEEWEGGEWQSGDVIGVYLTLGAEEPRGLRGHDGEGGADGGSGRAAGGRGSKGGRSKARGSKGRSGRRTKAEMAAMYEKELQQRYERREREREERERDKDKQPTTTTPTTTSSPSPSPPPPSATTAEQDKVSLLLSQQKATIFFLASSLRFYRNGRPLSAQPAFTNLFRGTYYPTVSLYMAAEVSVNFGPAFSFCPAEVSGGWYEPRGAELGDGESEGGVDEEDGEEKLRWLQEERMEELRDRGLLRHYVESGRAALIDNSRHVSLKVEKEREKEEEEREKERRQKEKEERERKEKLDKEREKELREQRDRERQAGVRRSGNASNSAAAAATVQDK